MSSHQVLLTTDVDESYNDHYETERIIKNVVAAISSDNATMEAIHSYYGIEEENGV